MFIQIKFYVKSAEIISWVLHETIKYSRPKLLLPQEY